MPRVVGKVVNLSHNDCTTIAQPNPVAFVAEVQ